MLNSEALRFTAENREGKIFLGVAGATVVVDTKMPRLSDGRTNRYAIGGTPIGVGENRHILTVAANRSGKSRNALVPNLISYLGSMLVIDPKGELAQITAARRKQLGQTVYVIDPFEAGVPALRPYAATFNPMAMLEYSNDLLADAGLIADALIVPTPGEKDPHWNDSAKSLIEGLILHVATCDKYVGRRDLVTVYELLWRLLVPDADGGPKYQLEKEMMQNLAAGGAVMHAAREFYERPDRERDSVLSTVRRHLHFIGYDKIQKTLRGSSFDLRDLKRQRVTIYLSLPAMRMGTCSRLLRLFVNLTLASFEMEKLKPRYPVLLCLDEFAVLGTMKVLEDAAGQISGLGCLLWPVVQDLGQIKSLYRDRWETFLGNAGILQFFGNSDMTTLEWISQRLGTTSVINASQSDVPLQSANASGATGKSWSTGTAPLLTPGEIAKLFGRDDELLRQLIIRPTVDPLVLHRAFYDKHEFFRGKYTDLNDGAGR